MDHAGMRIAARGVTAAAIMIMGSAPMYAQRNDEIESAFRWRNIGPATMMGRISAIDALNDDYRTVLIGSASGGVFKSTNGGITFTPIFDRYGSQSIGDVEFFQGDPNIIWVGTGEATNRNSVGWGDGVYKSIDGGKTFTNMGLGDTHQIAEILTHPTDPDIVYVAALGHLWGYSGSRGLFKTTDGGLTWEKLTNGLPDDGRTGATVITAHPDNPDVLFVGMYERIRKPYTMLSGGPNGGLFKSTDAGNSWRKLTDGLPTGETGQIDVDLYRKDPSLVWAYIEASDELPDDLNVPGPGAYRSTDGGETWTYMLRHNSRPYYHGRIRVNPADDQLVYIVARDFFHSTDGGKSFQRGRPWRGGGDDHDMWIDPNNKNIFYNATDQGAYLSVDGGASTLSFNNMAIGQYYAIGVDMRDPYWVYGGLQDNGGWAIPSNSRDRQGVLNDHVTVTNGGDGFHMQIDPTDWRTLYTTAHVGYFGRQNMETREHVFITPTPYTTSNFDEYYDPNFDETQTNYSINPQERWLWGDIPNRAINGTILPPQFRWNWNAPLVMSPTNPRTIYVGSSYLFKSIDRGDTWRIISPDLTTNNSETRNTTNSGGLTKDATGAENTGTIYTVDESPVNSGVVWVGTDDGNVQVTRDGGANWSNVRENIPGIPEEIWVSRVEASHFHEGTAYVTLDGHWVDDYTPYVFKTTDFGVSWEDISGNIPRANPGNTLYTIVEDFENENLLFIGTEFGVFVTIDGGKSWSRFRENLPPVAVHDLVIHPRDADLVAGTHGRSIWIADDITPLQQLTEEVLQSEVYLFENRIATKWSNITKGRIQNYFKFRGDNPPPGASINFYLRTAPTDSVRVVVEDPFSERRRTITVAGNAGINRARWDLRFFPNEEQIQAHRALLRGILDTTATLVREARGADVLDQMRKDLLATQRYPNRYDDADYPETNDARTLLLDHLRHIGVRLDRAATYRDLFQVREQLLAYSHVMGDRAFFGFYGEELTATTAAAARYTVTVTVDGTSYVGKVTVRDDPLKRN
ncbi:MAG: hypothetical protein IID05_05545 [Gemmatimonadetes bacterium]|nr:hypothetical protein [Gemmatimonadota bacterium]